MHSLILKTIFLATFSLAAGSALAQETQEKKEAGNELTASGAEQEVKSPAPVKPTGPAKLLLFHPSSKAGGLAAFACYDGGAQGFLAMEGCANLLKKGEKVQLESGKKVKLKNPKKLPCFEPDKSLDGFGAEVPADIRFAVWPAKEPGGLVLFKDNEPVKDRDLGRMLSLASAKVKDPLRLYTMAQVASAELDGDDVRDKVFVLMLVESQLEWESTVVYTGLYLKSGKNPDKLVLLLDAKKGYFNLVGALDLDGSGKKELIIEEVIEGGGRLTLLQLNPGGAAVIARTECGL